GFDLPKILHSWKRHTALEANRRLRREGEFWQPEYYDHLIRDDADLRRAVDYVWQNPDKAGLKDWRWRGRDNGAIGALLAPSAREDESVEHGLKTRATAGSNRGTGFQPVSIPSPQQGD